MAEAVAAARDGGALAAATGAPAVRRGAVLADAGRVAAAGVIREAGALLAMLATARAFGVDLTVAAEAEPGADCDLDDDGADSVLRTDFWDCRVGPPGELWLAGSFADGSACAAPGAPNMQATAPRVNAPAASHVVASLGCCGARWRAAV